MSNQSFTPEDRERTRKKFSNNLDELISKSHKSLAEISKATGIATGSLSQYKNNTAQAPITALASLANYFNVSADYLLGLVDVMSPEMDLRSTCLYTGLSEKAAELFHQLSAFGVSDNISSLGMIDIAFCVEQLPMNVLSVLFSNHELLAALHAYLSVEDEKSGVFRNERANSIMLEIQRILLSVRGVENPRILEAARKGYELRQEVSFHGKKGK